MATARVILVLAVLPRGLNQFINVCSSISVISPHDTKRNGPLWKSATGGC